MNHGESVVSSMTSERRIRESNQAPADRLSAVMLAYNHWNFSERCLESILLNSRVLRSMFVIDNASTDETSEKLLHYRERFGKAGISFKVIRLDQNIGFAKGMNYGLEQVRADPDSDFDYFAIISNDTYLMAGWDSALIEAQKRSGVDVVSPFPIETAFSADVPEALLRFASRNRGRYRNQHSMIVALFTRKVLDAMGLFDPEFFVGYEDLDLKFRFDRAKCRYRVVGDSVIWHQSKGTRGQDLDIEYFGLKTFISKWGFDPRKLDYTPTARIRRLFRQLKTRLGWV